MDLVYTGLMLDTGPKFCSVQAPLHQWHRGQGHRFSMKFYIQGFKGYIS